VSRAWHRRARGTALALVISGAAHAQAAPLDAVPMRTPDSASVVPGAEYRIGGPLAWLDRWLFGSRYRSLWTDTLRAPMFDLSRFDGGLRPIMADTQYGAREIFLAGAERRYSFRLLDPKLDPLVPADVRTAAVTGPVQDLVSGLHPGAPYVTAPLARAVHLAEQDPLLVMLTRDSALGGWRPAFGQSAGYLRSDVLASTITGEGASIDTDSLAALLDLTDASVDAAAFLRARLFDVFVGSTHLVPSAQRWLFVASDFHGWRPLPTGHQMAFARFDGLVAALARPSVPLFTVFGGKYPSGLGETEYQLAVDRRFLGSLAWATWEATAKDMQSELTDSVIDAAVRALPAPWGAQSGARLAKALKSRRDRLPEGARALYTLLAAEPDVYAPVSADTILVGRVEDGALDMAVPSTFQRRFLGKETKEVRLYLAGGNPLIIVRGAAYGGPKLRIITGTARATIIDSSTAMSKTLVVNDSAQLSTVIDAVAGAPPTILRAPAAPPSFSPLGKASAVKPAQDARYGPILWFEFGSNLGVLLGGGFERIGYEGDYAPYRSRQWLRFGYATQPKDYAVQYPGDFRFAHGSTRLYVDAERSGITLLRFYGLGNTTVDTGSGSFYSSRQTVYSVYPSLVFHLNKLDTVAIGPLFKSVRTDTTVNNFINSNRPYGWPSFDELGIKLAFAHDTRDSPVAPRSGALVAGTMKYFPAVLDAGAQFGGVAGAVSTYWTPDAEERFTVAVRAGGEKIWGPFPAFESAFLGGETTVGGLPVQRYAGDASAYGNFEARWQLAPLPFVLRWDFGVSGIVDAGRVFATGQSSDHWHAGYGGAIWAMLPDRSIGGTLALMYAEGNLALYAGTAFRY
jgi:hypothetical protein